MNPYFQDSAGEWRWRIRARNGEILATSEGYTSEEDAHRCFIDLAVAIGHYLGYR